MRKTETQPSNNFYFQRSLSVTRLWWIAFIFLIFCVAHVDAMHITCKSTEEREGIGRTVSELGKRIAVIFQDSTGAYWFGGDSGVYHYKNAVLIQYTVADGLCHNRVRGIQEDNAGNMYFDSGYGISKFDGCKFEILEENNASKNEWKLNANDIFFSGRWDKRGPYRYDGKQLYYQVLPQHELEVSLYVATPNVSFEPYAVYKTYKDSKGYWWIGTSTFGACRFDGAQLLWISEREMTEIDPGPAPGVRSILEDQEGYFWFSSNMEHKYKISDDGKSYQKHKGIDRTHFPEDRYYFMAIEQTDDGDIWLVSYDGYVWRYDGTNVTQYEVKINETWASIFTIYKDKQGNLWLGTHNLGALLFDGTSFQEFQIKSTKN